MDYGMLVRAYAERHDAYAWADVRHARLNLPMADLALVVRSFSDRDAGELFVGVDHAALRDALADAMSCKGEDWLNALGALYDRLARPAWGPALERFCHDVQCDADAIRECDDVAVAL